jgi:two-component system LytT family response regulator
MIEAAAVTVLIADDEPLARAGLARMLAEFDWLRVVGEAAHGTAAVAAIDTLCPELVFLDIQMPGLDGLGVLAAARHPVRVIFTTAFSQYAVSAFELGALDYLLKPFGPERLAQALERARAALGEPQPAPGSRLAETFGRGPLKRLFVRSGRRIVPLAIADVRWFEAVGDYVCAHHSVADHLLHVALARLEARLDPAHFVRIHRTHLINLQCLRAFRQLASGQLVAELDDGTTLPVSRAHAQSLRKLAR